MPEFLKELKALGTAEEIADACARKDLEISPDNAAKLLEQFRKAEELNKENLEEVAGGGRRYSGTRKLVGLFRLRASGCELDCWDADNDSCWDWNNDGIDDNCWDWDWNGNEIPDWWENPS